MTAKTLLWGTVAAGIAFWYVRRAALYDHEVRKAAGLQAAIDATANGYTTYNTRLYTPQLFGPIVRFFNVGAYAPRQTGPGTQQQNAVVYSMQG